MDHSAVQELPQKLTLEDRKRLAVSGVKDVENFDENTVVLHTNRGVLIIRGRGLRMKQLSVDGGQVTVEGSIDALIYEEGRKEGFWARLFG